MFFCSIFYARILVNTLFSVVLIFIKTTHLVIEPFFNAGILYSLFLFCNSFTNKKTENFEQSIKLQIQ